MKKPWRQMKYVGPNPVLKDKTALIREGGLQGNVLAQFDDMMLPLADDGSGLPYGFGWHVFRRKHFCVMI